MTVEHYIDKPMRKIIAALNLLGVNTGWCCCGYNYEGQPDWKFHEKQMFFTFELGDYHTASSALLYGLVAAGLPFKISKYMMQSGVKNNTSYVQVAQHIPQQLKDHVFNTPNTTYHFEMACQAVNCLEKYLIKQFSANFAEVASVEDINQTIHEKNTYWEMCKHASTEPWIVTKEFLEKDVKEFKY